MPKLSKEELEATGLRTRPWEFSHDSIELDVFPRELLQVLPIIQTNMETRCLDTVPEFAVPLKVDMEIGTRWDGAVTLDDYGADWLHVSGKTRYFTQLRDALARTATVRTEVVREWDEPPAETWLARKSYEGESAQLRDCIEAYLRLD